MVKHLDGFDIKDLKLVVVTNTESFRCNIDNNLVIAIEKERKKLAERIV